MNITPSSSGTPRWTLADFLSSYSFWALFVSTLFVSAGGQVINTFMPMLAREAGATTGTIGLTYVGFSGGWIIGAFIAFVVAPRHGRSVLIWPLIACAAVTLVFLPMPQLWASPFVLILFGLTYGMAQAVFALAVAIMIFGGRPSRIDFGGLLVLLSATTLAATFTPAFAGMLWEAAGSAAIVIPIALCMIIAMVFVLAARNLDFEGTPRTRHKPLAPRKRSPAVIVAILLAPVALYILTMLGTHLLSPATFVTGDFPDGFYVMICVIFVVSVIAFIYLGYWLYRIHGELAGAAASQRLLTPLAAIPIGLFVPLGLPVMVMTLGDLLNDRAKDKGEAAPLSVAWLAIFTILIPPIGIAMIQSAANRSYAPGAGMPVGGASKPDFEDRPHA